MIYPAARYSAAGNLPLMEHIHRVNQRLPLAPHFIQLAVAALAWKKSPGNAALFCSTRLDPDAWEIIREDVPKYWRRSPPKEHDRIVYDLIIKQATALINQAYADKPVS